MVSEQNLILLGTLKIKNVAPLFGFLVHCLRLKTLWNNLTFCKTRSVTNNKDLTLGNWGIFQRWKLTSPFDKLLLCSCRCHTYVKFWYMYFIFSWNVLITYSRIENAIKFLSSLLHQMLLYWKKYEKVEKEHRKRAEKEAMEQRKLDDEFREVRIVQVCWFVDWWMYCWCLNFQVHCLIWSVFQFNAFVCITQHKRIPCKRRQISSSFLMAHVHVHVHCESPKAFLFGYFRPEGNSGNWIS